MRRKCKVCGGPLDSEMCFYCGTDHSASKQISSQSVDSSNHDSSTEDSHSFDVPNTQPQYSQPVPMMELESKGVNPAIIIGAILILIIIVAAWFIFSGGTDSRFASDDSYESSESSDLLEESTLLGSWGNGRGSVLLFVFNEADSVEFLEDGTVMIIQGSSRWLTDWEIDAPGSFTADGEQFSYSIDDDTLVITDSWNDDWTFDRVASGTVSDTTNLSNDGIDGAPIGEADLIGTWGWDFNDDFIYVFNSDGTAVRGFSDLHFDFNWELVDDNIIYIHFGDHNFGTHTERWSAVIENGVLTLADLDGYDVWQYVRGSDSTDTAVTITDSALLGTWVDGWGPIFLWVFDQADAVEFLDDGTLIITQGRIREEISWRPGAQGTFSAGGQPFTYSVNGNILVITDSNDDNWTFEREDDNADKKDDNDIEISTNNLIGTWEWDSNDDYIYIFNDDGSATRGFSHSHVDFQWELTDNNVIYMNFENDTERWDATINNDILTISSLDNDQVWRYVRVD